MGMLGVLVTVVVSAVVGYIVFVLCFDAKKEEGTSLEDFIVKSDGE